MYFRLDLWDGGTFDLPESFRLLDLRGPKEVSIRRRSFDNGSSGDEMREVGSDFDDGSSDFEERHLEEAFANILRRTWLTPRLVCQNCVPGSPI